MSDPLVRVDAARPWLGLLPFKEEHRDFFFGRDAEIREILQRIRDNTLTILFGQSGLGKSSLIGAGVVPGLGESGFRAIHLRLDHLPGSPPPLEQTREAFRKILPAAAWPEDAAEITLWELFHRSPGLADPEGEIPVLIFDQFEEIFTLGRQGGRGDEAEEWLSQIADLVQNRPPASLEDRFAGNRRLARDYDFSEAALRIVLALREDYLSHLEAWKPRLPLLMRNRMALGLLDGAQALQAVLGPASLGAAPLVSREVAADIVRTVADVPPHTPVAAIRAVPPLLSLLCEQLNEARLAAGATEIAAALVEERSADILHAFYEESYAPFPQKERSAIRRIIEDPPMVTEGGFRNSLVREDAEKELAAKGVADPKAVFNALIQRRLITSEDKAGHQRLEITHDVLVPLLVRSRTERREREATEKARQQRRKMTAIVGGLMLLVAVFASLTVWALRQSAVAEEALAIAKEQTTLAKKATARAEKVEAEATAQKEKALADRKQAEEIVKFLLYDMRDKLTAIGRSDILAAVQEKIDAYYEAFGVDAGDLAQLRERATALHNRGDLHLGQGKLDEAAKSYAEALAISRKLAEADPTALGWLDDLGFSLNRVGNAAQALGKLAEAAEAYGQALTISRKLAKDNPETVVFLDGLGQSLEMVGNVTAAQVKFDEAAQAYRESLAIRRKLAEADPANTQWQSDLGRSYGRLGDLDKARGRLEEAAEAYSDELPIRRKLAETDPDNWQWQSDLAYCLDRFGALRSAMGRKEEALAHLREALEIIRRLGNKVWGESIEKAIKDLE